MSEKRIRIITNTALISVASIFAAILRHIAANNPKVQGTVFFVVLTIYFGMLAYWGVSVQRRIIDRRVRHFLLIALGGMVAWVLLHALYTIFVPNIVDSLNLLQYAYLICIMVTMHSIFYMAIFIGKDANFKTSGYCRLADGFSIFICAWIMVHDYFSKTVKLILFNRGYDVDVSYIVFAIWDIVLALSSFSHIARSYSTKEMKKKFFWPLSVFFIGTVVFLIYLIMGDSFYKVGFFDNIVLFCMIIIGILECLIQTGLIPSNTDYVFCMYNSVLNMEILNYDGETVFSSASARKIDDKLFDDLKSNSPVLIDGNSELYIDNIRGGYVVWEKNIKDENELLEELDSIKSNLESANSLLKKNIEIEGRRHRLEERSRLYDLVINKINLQISEIEERLNLLENASPAAAKMLVGEINTIGVYIKRKSNLILLEELKSRDLGKELKMSFKETFDILNKSGIKADFLFREIPNINIDIALIMYDFLETVIENAMSEMEELVVILTDASFATSITANVTLKSGHFRSEDFLLQSFSEWNTLIDENYNGRIAYEADEENYTVCLVIPKGGADIWK